VLSLFENEQNKNVTFMIEWYSSMVENFLFPELCHLSIQDAWYQQDGVKSRITMILMEVLQNMCLNLEMLTGLHGLQNSQLWTYFCEAC